MPSRKRVNLRKAKSGCSTCKERKIKCDETTPTCQRCQRSGRVCRGLWKKAPTSLQPLAPNNSLDPENRQWRGLTWVEMSTVNNGHGYTEASEMQEKSIQAGDCDPLRSMVEAEPKLSADSTGRVSPEDGLEGGTNMSPRSSIITNREDSKDDLKGKRSADGVLLPEATTVKRARRDKDEEDVGNFIIVSPGAIQAIGEDEHPKSISAPDAPGAASKGDGAVFQSSHRMSSEAPDTTEMARGALLALDGNSTDSAEDRRYRVRGTELSQDDVPCNPYIRPDHASLSSPSPDGDSQCWKDASNQGISASQNLVTLPATLDAASQLSNSQRTDNRLQNTAATQNALDVSGFQASGTSSIAQNGQSASIDNLSPHPDGLPRFNNDDELTTILRSPHSGPFQSMTQATGGAPPHTSNQTSTQNADAGSQPFPLQRISSADITVGKNPPDRLNADSFDNQTGSAMYTPSSNAPMPAADFMGIHQAPAYKSQQRNKPRSGDMNKSSRGEGYPSVGPNQPQSSANITNTRTSIPHGMGPENRLRPDEHSHASSRTLNSPRPSAPRPPAGSQPPHHLYVRPPPPLPSPTHPPGFSIAPQNNYQPPAVQFTIDNRYESALSPADVRPLLEIFSRHAQLLLGPKEAPTRPRIHPVGTLMWQNSPDFYKWYLAESGTAEVSVLRFELVDVLWQPEKVLHISGGNLHHFQILKQYIWNLFWEASHVNGTPTPFRILITAASHVTTEPQQCSWESSWNSVNATAPAFPAEPSMAANPRNVRAAVDPPAAITHRARHESPSTNRAQVPHVHFAAPPLHLPKPDHSNTAKRQTHFPPVQANHLGRTTRQPIRDLSSPVHRVGTSVSAGTDVPVTHSEVTAVFCNSASRTASDQQNLRNSAMELIAGREDIELEDNETTGGRTRIYPDVCGVVVDTKSAKGMVVVSGRGFPVQQVDTGPGGAGSPYAELMVRHGQKCVIYGSSTVIYYKSRKAAVSHVVTRQYQPREAPQPRVSSSQQPGMVQRPTPEIIIRLQADGTGKFSTPYNKSVMNRTIPATEFFAWFANRTGRGGSVGPPSLRFTFKDAVPVPKSSVIAQTNSDHFNLMRKDMRDQFEKAREYMPNLMEFAVLVTDPEWVSVSVEEDEDW